MVIVVGVVTDFYRARRHVAKYYFIDVNFEVNVTEEFGFRSKPANQRHYGRSRPSSRPRSRRVAVNGKPQVTGDEFA